MLQNVKVTHTLGEEEGSGPECITFGLIYAPTILCDYVPSVTGLTQGFWCFIQVPPQIIQTRSSAAI
jgi:hypothetical protein